MEVMGWMSSQTASCAKVARFAAFDGDVMQHVQMPGSPTTPDLRGARSKALPSLPTLHPLYVIGSVWPSKATLERSVGRATFI